MFQISTKGRYGLRALLDMVMNQMDGPVPLKSIASRQDISEGYLEQLMIPLKKAQLVKSVRGVRGGYLLNRDPAAITISDIICALEGPIAPTACVNEDNPADCSRAGFCPSKVIWTKVRDAVAHVLNNYTLADLALEARQSTDENSDLSFPEKTPKDDLEKLTHAHRIKKSKKENALCR